MSMKSTVIVTGAKPSKGEMEGRPYDSTKIYTQILIDESTGGDGYASTEYTWGKSDNYQKIKDIKKPFEAELTIEMVSNGKSVKMIVLDVKPIQSPIKV